MTAQHGPHAGPHEHLNRNVRGLTPSATIAINERSRALLAGGRHVVRFGLGQSPFPVPGPVVEALARHAQEKDYLPARGLPALREAVAGYLHRSQGLKVDPEHVLVGPGSKELLFLLQLVYHAPLLLAAPSWVSYAPQARIVGCPVTWLPTTRERGHVITPEQLDAACQGSPRPRLMILNYPGNPTGTTYTPGQLEALAEVARHHRLLVVSDEIYGELDFAGTHQSMARYYPEGTVVSGGLSKWCGAGGWRLGAFAFPPALADLVDAMTAVASETYTAVAAPIQHAAVRAFQGGPEIDDYLARSRAVLQALLIIGWQMLCTAGARVCEPRGGFYLYPNFDGYATRLARRGIHDAPTLCRHLLDDTGVAVLPGSDFGEPPEVLTLRMALVDFDGAAALANVPEHHGGYLADRAFLDACCAPTITGMRDLCGWFEGL